MSAYKREAQSTPLQSTPLFKAVLAKDAKAVDEILSTNKSNIETRDEDRATPLILAAESDDLETVRILVKHKANIEAKSWSNHTPLLSAVAPNTTPNVVRFLLENKANTNAQTTDGSTVLHLAVTNTSNARLSILSLLLKHNPQPNLEAKNIDGYTPLLCAAKLGRADVVGELIRHGADIHATNKNGEGLAKIATGEAAKLCQNPTKLSLHLADGFLETDSTLKQLPESKNEQEAISQVLKNLKSESKKNEVLTELCNSLEAKRPESFKETLARLKGFYTAFDKTNYSTATIVRTEFNRALFNYSFQAISLQIGSANNIVATPKTPEAKKLKEYLAQLKEMVPTSTPVRILFFDTIADKEIANHPAKIYCAIKALQLCLNCSPSAKKTELDILSESFLNLATIKTESQIPKPTEESKSTTTQEQKSTKTKRLDFLFHDGLTEQHFREKKELRGPERFKTLREAKRFIRDGSLPTNSHNKEGFSTLIYLILNGFSLLTRNFLSLNEPDLGYKDKRGLTALHWAAYKGDTVVVRALIASMAAKKRLDLLDTQTLEGHTPLILAAFGGHLDIVKLLLAAGTSLHTPNKYGETALELAIKFKQQHVIDFLEQYQALSTENSSDSAPDSKETTQQAEQEIIEQTAQKLIDAIKTNDLPQVTKILDTTQKDKNAERIKGIINYVDNSGKTPWHYADNNVRTLLAQYSAEANKQKKQLTPQESFLKFGAVNPKSTLEERQKWEEEQEAVCQQKITAEELIAAIKDSDHGVLKQIFSIAQKAKNTIRDSKNEAAIASATKTLKTFENIVNHVDNQDGTPWFYAVIEDNIEVMLLLIEYGADVNRVNKFNQTALFMAAHNGNIDAIETLLSPVIQRPLQEKNIRLEIESKSRKGNTALSSAVVNGHLQAVTALLAAGANYQTQNDEGQTPLQIAESSVDDTTPDAKELRAKRAEIATCIREFYEEHLRENKDVPTSFINKVNAERLEKLLAPIRPTDIDKHDITLDDERWEIMRETQKRIARGVDVNSTDKHGGNLLIYLLINGYASLTRKVLLMSPNSIDLKFSKYQINALHLAVCVGDPVIMRMLLETLQITNQLALIDTQDINGYTPLMKAILLRDIDMAKLLIAAGADFKKPQSNNGNSAYKIAQQQKLTELTTFMDVFGQAVRDEKTVYLSDKQRALTVGMFTDTADEALFENEEQRQLFAQQCRERKSQELISALRDGETEKVARLTANLKPMSAAKDKEAKDAKHVIPLLNFDLHHKDANGRGFLHYAAIAGNDRLVSLLLEHKADIKAVTKIGSTALHTAALLDRPTIIDILLKADPDLAKVRNKDGLTPLALAKATKQFRAAHLLEHSQKPESSFFSSVMQFFTSEKPESKEPAKEPEKAKEKEDDGELFTASSTPVGMGMSLNGEGDTNK